MSRETNVLRRGTSRVKKSLVVPQTIVTSPGNSVPGTEDSFRHDDGVRLEEQLQLRHLEQLRYWFENHRLLPPVANATRQQHLPWQRGRLNRDDFKQVIAMVIGSHDYDDQLDSLFTKLDSTCDGYVDWDEFCSYILIQLREGDYGQAKKMIPFNSEPRIRHIVYNRQETTSRIIALDNPTKYATVSKEGVICVWDSHLHLERHSEMTSGEPGHPSSRRLVKEWVTDAVHMANTRKVVIASTGRDLRFFDVTSGQYVEENHLYALPHIPTCLHYWYDTKSPGSESILLFGDDHGAINLLYFREPLSQLFNAPFNKRQQGSSQRIYSQELPAHGRWMRHVRVEDVHPAEPVRKLLYMAHCDRVMSSSACPRNSLAVTHVERKKKTYVFKSNKGVECFDYSRSLNIIVTGSLDHIVRVWNPYVTSKPIGVLVGHSMGVVDVVIHNTSGHIFSCSKDAVLKVWDTKDYTCIQTIFLKFPTNLAGRLPEYGPFAMHLQPPPANTLLLAANDYIALLRVGPVAPPATDGTVSHLAQLYGALYNSYYKQVVTGADDSMLAVWDIETGVKCLVFSHAHDTEEITAMAFDDSRRRLITGARDGSIKVWNIQNGQSLQTLQRVSDAEVTGVVQLADRKLILAVGWNRLITVYDDSDPDCATVKADTSWKGGQVHRDDIISVAHCPPTLLATASFDGEICVWSIETQLLIVRLRRPSKCSKFKLPLDLSALISGFTPPTTPSSRPTSHPNSRPNSRHRRSYRNPPGQPIPVDKLLFLEAKERGKKGEAATLISSEAGYLHWWNVWMPRHEMGHCYLPDEADEAVLALATDSTNSVLVSGDTQGRVAVWDISDYCTSVQQHRVTSRPRLTTSWTAHDSTVVSVEYVVHDSGVFVLTASTDKKAKLFTIDGQCIGTFGQKRSWNLKTPKTWEDQPQVVETLHPTEDATLEQHQQQHYGDDTDSSPELLQQEPHRNDDSSIRTTEEGTPFNDSSTDNDGDDEDDEEEMIRPDITNTSVRKLQKPISVGPGGLARSKGLHCNARDLLVRSHTFAYGSQSPLTSKLLGLRVEKHLEKRTLDRQGRREQLADVDFKQVTKTGNQCCPYKLLATKELSDIFLPTNMPVTPRMISRGYTSADLTVSMVSSMDITSLYSDDPLQTRDASTRAKKLWEVAMDKLPAITRSRSYGGNFPGARPARVGAAQKRRVSANMAATHW
ncbi:WD repeat-containing protein 49 [Lamellibrachia satsuma]|nr:WD repeat-containing protein 49 [Lamellibrachia satsuma]